ncbi:2-hydroxyacid dehydrogenase [Streptococcaceae bacterium ESL0687]|nr:2-hydroxyacid dehydrogenase [Streptococcaceae bacterium ESL0687]
MLKIACYGVRPNEKPYFEKLNKYNYDLSLIEDLLTHDNIDTTKGQDAVLLRGNCVADKENLEKMKSFGVRYVFTRTVGFNHIDLDAAKELGLLVARVPGYSPNAIAELALTLGMSLLRNVSYTVDRTSQKNFTVTPQMFSREIRNCTVGILGTGKIGLVEAKLYKGLGARVVAYDIYQSDEAKEVVEFLELDELLETSDIVSLHLPYFPGKNDKLVNQDFLAKMKDDAILINTARGELQDNEAILKALQENTLGAFGTDVMPNETSIFFKEFSPENPMLDSLAEQLVDLYPRVLITPHIGSNTDEALKNMIEISFDNFNDVETTGTCPNLI